MPSTTSSVVSIVLDSSTVIVPSLPTFSIASAILPPISVSPLAEIVATFATSSAFTFLESLPSSSTAASTALSTPRLSIVGLAPAVTFLRPSL